MRYNLSSMSNKKQTLIGLGLSLLGLGVSYLILHADLQAGSTGELLVRLGKGLYYGMGALAIVFVILYFVSNISTAISYKATVRFSLVRVTELSYILVRFPHSPMLISSTYSTTTMSLVPTLSTEIFLVPLPSRKQSFLY